MGVNLELAHLGLIRNTYHLLALPIAVLGLLLVLEVLIEGNNVAIFFSSRRRSERLSLSFWKQKQIGLEVAPDDHARLGSCSGYYRGAR